MDAGHAFTAAATWTTSEWCALTKYQQSGGSFFPRINHRVVYARTTKT